MAIAEREQKALEVYIKLLKSKGFGPESFEQRTEFLNNLMPLLAGVEQIGSVYRNYVEALMDSMPEGNWPESLLIAREYYPFWANDIKLITSLTQGATEDTLPLNWQPAETKLETLWHSVDKEKFGRTDSWALKAYTKALRFENAEQKLIDTRLKLAKILLAQLRDAPNRDNKAYRITVDATLPLFEVKKNRRLFLVVVREFYHFWAGNPDAKEHVLKDNGVSML
jgi:hypothetical protein